VKVVNVGAQAMPTRVDIRGLTGAVKSATATVLASDDPFVENSLAEPTKIVPATAPLAVTSGSFEHTFPANSVTVLRLELAK
jgi:alpha-L-arabinofuranosidase